MSDAVPSDRWPELRQALVDRAKLTTAGGLLLGIAGIAMSDAGGPSAALLDVALLGLALWLGRSPSGAPATSRAPASNSAMTGNQALLLVLALGGAAVLIAAGAASRPLHGLAVAPFAMAAFALSSQNSRDLRSGVLAAAASLLVLSSADSRAVVMTLCAVGLVPLVFGWAAVRQLMTIDRFPDLALGLSRASRPWPLALVARLVVLTAVLSLLMPSEPPPHLRPGDGPTADSAGPGLRGDAIAAGLGGLDLRLRGGLDAEPILDVPGDSPSLWQGGFVDNYSGAGWSLTLDRSQRPVVITLPDRVLMRDDGNYRIATVHRLAGARSALVYSPGQLVGADAASGQLFWLAPGSVSVFDRNQPWQPYTINYRQYGYVGHGFGLVPAAVADQRWVQLPDELPYRVRDLARTVTASAVTMQDKVSSIENYLRTHEKYSLDSPVPADDEDAVDAFLFTDHVGFCEQFASAEAVMLRALGIPARVATGYGGSGVRSATAPDRRVYRNQDAHAWVQVGYPDGTWLDSDPTAGAQLASGSATHRLAAWFKQLWKTLTGGPLARAWTALGLLVAAAVTVLLSRVVGRARRRRRRQPKAAPPVALPTAAGMAYQRLLLRLAAQGRPRLPTETVRDVLFRLGAPEPERIIMVLESEWYGPPITIPAPLTSLVVAALDALAVEQPVGTSP